MKGEPSAVVLVGINAPGYHSLALDYLEVSAKADPRLDIALQRFDVDTSTDPWWIAYRILSLDRQVDVVALPVMCWTARHVYEVARLVKAERPETLVVVGGPEASPLAEELLRSQPSIDAVIRGEGEFAFCDLLHSHIRGGDICGVAGVTGRDGDAIVSGPDRPPIEDLDSVLSPFSSAWSRPTDGSAYIETYRGCPHRCAYCYEGKGSSRIRSFSWDRIASDIETLATTPGMQAFSFIDPVFNLTDDRLTRLAELMRPHAVRGIRLHTVEVDIERVDDAQAALLSQAGVVSVETGPQTTGAVALSTCQRSFDEGRFRAGIEACRKQGISVECDIIVGLPGDGVDDVLASMDFALSLDPGRVQMSTLHVLPGTELWRRSDELGLRFDSEPPHEVISTRELSYADLRRLEVLGNAAAGVYSARIQLPSQGARHV